MSLPRRQVAFEPFPLELLVREEGWDVLIHTSKLAEVVCNVKCLEVEVGIFKVDEGDPDFRCLMVDNILQQEIIVTKDNWRSK